MIARALSCAVLLCLTAGARAAILPGSDMGGADLIPADGDVLRGTFTRVGIFDIPPGATVYAAPGIPLAVYASTISIRGALDGRGRGQAGGGGGPAGGAGLEGFGGDPAGTGAGGGGAAAKGGGGGGGGAAGGAGAGAAGGQGGAAYGAVGVLSPPLSADDVLPGSGGGGGGGGTALTGGSGAAGGAAVYLEASSITLSGSIIVSGEDAATGTGVAAGANAGAGGGGGGGSVLLRALDALGLTGAIRADGGRGGSMITIFGGVLDPGGGGAGGRVKVYYRRADVLQVIVSTAGGAAGTNRGITGIIDVGGAPQAGGAGSAAFGLLASSPTGFGSAAVHATSVSWTWSGDSWGDAPQASRVFRVYSAAASSPWPAPMVQASSSSAGAVETGLQPNTTVQRFVTAYTDYGDSLPSTAASTHTLASVPSAPAFSSVGQDGLTLAWGAGAEPNPSYTVYEVERSTQAGFSSSAAAGAVVALSSSPSGLTPNTTYHLRVRAINLGGVPTDFTETMTTATLAAAPSNPAFDGVHITSLTFSWSGGGNPAGTIYRAEISTDNFFTLSQSSATLSLAATFFDLAPGRQVFLRAAALNHAGRLSAYSLSVSTLPGDRRDLSAPGTPGAPQPDRAFSYDANAVFRWTPAQSGVGILDYFLEIGSTPGGNDFFSGYAGNALSYAASGLASGRTYYARVRARSNSGTLGEFSGPGAGVAVYRTDQEQAFLKPRNWPNPFDPDLGPTQIGFHLEEPAEVTLKIFTLQGDLVQAESRRVDASGNQVWTWNGKNGRGITVSPGGYIGLLLKNYPGRSQAQKFKMAVLY